VSLNILKNKLLCFSVLIQLLTYNYSFAQTNIPPKIIAIGNQAYCPLSQINIVTGFNIIDSDDTDVIALFIQISTGYDRNNDVLKLTNKTSHPNISTSWSTADGKLTIKSSGTGNVKYVDIIAAVKDIVFVNSSLSVLGNRTFSFTIGNVNFLPLTGHYYEFVPDFGITWTDAKIAAENRTYFGLKGYLATLTSQQESNLAGKQSTGAGWIGGSDAETEGVWKWMTGPEVGIIFWNGDYTGSTPNFAFWNTGEPNNLGNEDYAHITDPSVGIFGSWNDLHNAGDPAPSPFHPKGYIVEYGGTPGDPVLDISASTKIFVPSISSVTGGSNCGSGAVTLSAKATSGNILWFGSETGGTPLNTGNTFNTPNIAITTTYYVLASENGCLDGIRTPVVANIFDIPNIAQSVELKNCDVDGIPDGFTDFNLEEANNLIVLGNNELKVSYYLTSSDANNNINVLNPSPFNNSLSNTVYARVENNDGCYRISKVNLKVSTTSFPKGFKVELTTCDDDEINDGLHLFNLSSVSDKLIAQFPKGQNLKVQYYRNLSYAQLEQNEILANNNYMSESPFSQIIYVRVESKDNGACFGIGPNLLLTVNPLPEFQVADEAILCINKPPITINTFNPKNKYSYTWLDSLGNIIGTNSNVTIASGGLYKVIATSINNCKSLPRRIKITESNIANISAKDIQVIDDSDNNSISINNQNNNLGIGNYKFALDNANRIYQSEPFFEHIKLGLHTLFVKDNNNCGLVSLNFSVIGFPKFFTPNGDGINDTWQVKGISFQPNSKIYIFDKFGKILKQLNANGVGWDGTFNGNILPNSDYWFKVKLDDGRVKTGHFSLIRK